MSEYRHNSGYICWGTLRIAKADFDTDPPEEFKKERLDELCNNGNRIAQLEAENGKLKHGLELANKSRNHWIQQAESLEAERDRLKSVLINLEKYLKGDDDYEHTWLNYPEKPELTPLKMVCQALKDNA